MYEMRKVGRAYNSTNLDDAVFFSGAAPGFGFSQQTHLFLSASFGTIHISQVHLLYNEYNELLL